MSSSSLPTFKTIAHLKTSHLVPAPPSTKIVVALLSLSMCDALGGPAEFKRRGTFKRITTMQPNHNFGGLKPGTFTDDTSMALCLAKAILTKAPRDVSVGKWGGEDNKKNTRLEIQEENKTETDATDLCHLLTQAQFYLSWRYQGYFSPTGACFDCGISMSSSLALWHKELGRSQSSLPPPPSQVTNILALIRKGFEKPVFRGNGSLMRVLPIPLAYWKSLPLAEREAERSSMVTHPDRMCREACRVYTRLVVTILQNADRLRLRAAPEGSPGCTKLDLLNELSSYPYTCPELATLFKFPHLEDGDGEQASPTTTTHPLLTTPLSSISSSGYVLHTLHAALWAFFNTDTFEDGAIEVVNMGDDADTVGAVYGGLAGAWYADVRWEECKEYLKQKKGEGKESSFWNERVAGWRKEMFEGKEGAMGWVGELGEGLMGCEGWGVKREGKVQSDGEAGADGEEASSTEKHDVAMGG